MNESMEPRWITLIDQAPKCLGCRCQLFTGEEVYSLIGTEDAVYCGICGEVAERALRQNTTRRDRERRIIAGLPV